jgi:hypothetical protein
VADVVAESAVFWRKRRKKKKRKKLPSIPVWIELPICM